MLAKYFYFWVINIVITIGDSNLGPQPSTVFEHCWWIKPLGHHGRFCTRLVFSKKFPCLVFGWKCIFKVNNRNIYFFTIGTLILLTDDKKIRKSWIPIQLKGWLHNSCDWPIKFIFCLGLSKKETCLRGRVAERPCGRN